MAPADFILMESAEAPGAGGATWTDEETLLLLEALELFGANWNEIADHVGTKTKAQCMLHFLQMPIEDSFLYAGEGNTTDETKSEKSEEKIETGEKGKEKEEEKGPEEKAADKMEMDEKKDSDEKKDGETIGDVNRSEPSDIDHTVEKDSDENNNSVLVECTPETAINVLKDAFKAVGFLPDESELGSFADAGNPVMALVCTVSLLYLSENFDTELVTDV
jgi:SWI/SNF related-matrix-associated actin-dependent regulator of chromatin subfamily C